MPEEGSLAGTFNFRVTLTRSDGRTPTELGDGGFQGSGIGVFTPIKHSKSAPQGCPLDIDNKTYNALLRGLRALCERGFALLTQRWHTLQHITTSPRKITTIVQAALTLTRHEHGKIH